MIEIGELFWWLKIVRQQNFTTSIESVTKKDILTDVGKIKSYKVSIWISIKAKDLGQNIWRWTL